MRSIFKKIQEAYFLDTMSCMLFFLIAVSVKKTASITIPLIIVLGLFQYVRFLKDRISKEALIYPFLYALIYTTVFYRSVQTVILILLLLFLIGLMVKLKPKKVKINIKSEVYIFGFFLLIVINSMLFKPYFKSIDTYLYLLFFPLLFFLLKKLSFTIDKVKSMRVFIFSVLVSSILLLIINAIDGNISLKTNTFFSKYLGLIHVYYGMFLAVAGCFLLILNKEKLFFLSITPDYIIFVFLVLLLIHIGARISLLALLFILGIFLFQKIPLPFFQKMVLIGVLGSFILFVTYKSIPRARSDIKYIEKVYTSVKENNKEDLVHNSWRNMYQRFLVTSYTVKEIKEHPVLGVGLQNVKDVISNKIIKDGYLYFKPINSHNQYLQLWVGMGIFALLYFLWMLFNFYKLQTYSIYFLTFFLIIMLTESLLVRVKGISLFFLFSLIFSFKEVRN